MMDLLERAPVLDELDGVPAATSGRLAATAVQADPSPPERHLTRPSGSAGRLVRRLLGQSAR
jgi:hypothetical protein